MGRVHSIESEIESPGIKKPEEISIRDIRPDPRGNESGCGIVPEAAMLGIRSDGIEPSADRPIRDIIPEIGLDAAGNRIGRPEEDGPTKVAPILNASLIPHFGSIENYEQLKRLYPNGIPASEIAMRP